MPETKIWLEEDHAPHIGGMPDEISVIKIFVIYDNPW